MVEIIADTLLNNVPVCTKLLHLYCGVALIRRLVSGRSIGKGVCHLGKRANPLAAVHTEYTRACQGAHLKWSKKKGRSARTRTRTEDLIITSDALYQLSHASWLVESLLIKKSSSLLVTRMCKKKKSARTRIRTEDLIITSDALYQLSHTSRISRN